MAGSVATRETHYFAADGARDSADDRRSTADFDFEMARVVCKDLLSVSSLPRFARTGRARTRLQRSRDFCSWHHSQRPTGLLAELGHGPTTVPVTRSLIWETPSGLCLAGS